MIMDATNNATKLKCCPFCGCKPKSGVEFYESRGGEVKLAAVIKCQKCGIRRIEIFNATNNMSLIPFDVYYMAFKNVVQYWNERYEEVDT